MLVHFKNSFQSTGQYAVRTKQDEGTSSEIHTYSHKVTHKQPASNTDTAPTTTTDNQYRWVPLNPNKQHQLTFS